MHGVNIQQNEDFSLLFHVPREKAHYFFAALQRLIVDEQAQGYNMEGYRKEVEKLMCSTVRGDNSVQ